MTKSKGRGRGFFGNAEQHRAAGKKGGEARKLQMASLGDKYEMLGHLGGKAAQRTGTAHRLTTSERAKGGRNSHRV